MQLKRLFEPINIGAIRSKNRLVMSPMGTNFSDKLGMVTPGQLAYYAERAKGGVGMITTEVTAVSRDGKTVTYQLGAYSDDCIPGLTKLARTINEHNCRSILQLHHAGRRATPAKNDGVIPRAPSPIPCVGTSDVPKELTAAEIEALVEDFADAALRSRKAGFDGVELHGAHGYLISQFLSPLSNKRTDKYSGSLENRTRFAIEIVKLIKDKAGSDYPVLFKISGDEFLPGGLTQADTRLIAMMLQDAGINAITSSAGHYGAAPDDVGMTYLGAWVPQGCLVHLAQSLKKAVSIPVGAVGRINNPFLAESILNENKADLIYMGRALLADPELPAKSMRGNFEDIRPCIACGMCNKTNQEPGKMRCAVNATLGREETFQIVPSKNPRKVLVVGGGAAGMEASRIAALRGHKVSLYEKNGQLGGQLLLASIPPHKNEIPNLVNYLSTQIRKLGIDITVGKEVTAETVKQLKPDAVILAAGSVPFIPGIPGIDGDNVVLAEDVLNGKAQIKGTSVVIVGGGIVGCETGEFLAVKGKKVTIIEMLPEIAGGMHGASKVALAKRLRESGVTISTNAKVKRITRQAVVLENGRELTADSVVRAAGRKPDRTLAEPLQEVTEVVIVGDCQNQGMIIDAIREGSEVARKI
ncbi:MAG: FAD-dependent oxidoreductase [Chloroflexi bacterium]|nr:FAD-dependent oxidoreductase [Chloroflexota bacterium]